MRRDGEALGLLGKGRHRMQTRIHEIGDQLIMQLRIHRIGLGHAIDRRKAKRHHG
jgi:hypothetical protein